MNRNDELLASILLLFSQKLGMDVDSDEFASLLYEEVGLEREELSDILELLNEI